MSNLREWRRQRSRSGLEGAGVVTRESGQQRQAFQTTIRSGAIRAQRYFAKHLIDFQHRLSRRWFEMHSARDLPKGRSQAEIARAFENAKCLAQFIGMILSLGFTVTLSTFCFEQLKTTTGWIDLSAYSISAVFFLGLAACLWFWVSSIGFRYFWDDVADNQLIWLKVTAVLLLLAQCFAITWAIFKFSGAVVNLIDAGGN